MTNETETKSKPYDGRNFIAELVSSGFTIIPGESGDRDGYGYINQQIMRYCIKGTTHSSAIIGRYMENWEIEGKPRFEIIYDLNDSGNMTSALRLKETLKELEVKFIETPSVEERSSQLKKGGELVSALEKSLK